MCCVLIVFPPSLSRPAPIEAQAYGREEGTHPEYRRARRTLQPCLRGGDVRILGVRDHDEDRAELGGPKIPVAAVGELGPLLRTLVRSPRCAGLDITVHDPDLDPDGTAGCRLTDLVITAFAED